MRLTERRQVNWFHLRAIYNGTYWAGSLRLRMLS